MADAIKCQARAIMDRILSSSPAVSALGAEILAASPGHAALSLIVRPEMVNGQGICHGGTLFSLADTAAALAALSHNRLAVTQNGSINYIAPARHNERLLATATETHRGGRSGIYDVRILVDDRLIALARTSFVILEGAVL